MTQETTLLNPTTEAQVRAIGKADILVGIPTYNNVGTIDHVIRAVRAGLTKYFAGVRTVLVHSDAGSVDTTADAVSHAMADSGTLLVRDQLSALHKIITPSPGIPGKGSILRTIFEIARRVEVKACAIVSADHRSISPDWIELLIRPVVEEGYDYVAPYYLRHKYDGLMTDSLLYPLIRTLYGLRVRQPIGGELGLSSRLTSHYLKKHVWESNGTGFGIDVWLITEAIISGARVCQSFLGAKIHPKDVAAEPSAILPQLIGALFALMEGHQAVWTRVRGSMPVPVFGFQYEVGVEPVKINVERMVNTFQHGLVDLQEIWTQMLAPQTMEQLLPLGRCPNSAFHLSDQLWTRVVFDLAISYHRRLLPKEHLLKAVTPLYLGRTASFVLQTQGLTSKEAESHIERLCETFEAQKPYLLARIDRNLRPAD